MVMIVYLVSYVNATDGILRATDGEVQITRFNIPETRKLSGAVL